jgi:hypothetical protein
MAVLLGQYAEQLGRVLGAAMLPRNDDDAHGLLDERAVSTAHLILSASVA